jgi:phosphosulfolactate phosphohydrolase-like enzyme
LGFHEKVMFFSWFSFMSSRMTTRKWPPEHAIFIDYLCQVNTIQYLNSFLSTTIFFTHFPLSLT